MTQSNIELLRRAWAAYNRGDEEGFAACLADDWREYSPDGGSATLEDERPTMELHRLAFPDKRTEFHRIVADEDTVASLLHRHCDAYGQVLGRGADRKARRRARDDVQQRR